MIYLIWLVLYGGRGGEEANLIEGGARVDEFLNYVFANDTSRTENENSLGKLRRHV